MYIDVTCLITDLDPSDLSASAAERGRNAGPETWANAQEAAARVDLPGFDDPDGVREWFAEFGAWDRAEIAAWSETELRALVLQYSAGDLRELQALAPGNGLGGIDWAEAERLAEAGTVGGSLYPDGDRLMAYVGN